MDMAREASNKGDRAKLTMSCKFPPHKSYGNNDDRPEYGLKA
ncbi:cyanate lyase [Methylobacterium sp. 1973]